MTDVARKPGPRSARSPRAAKTQAPPATASPATAPQQNSPRGRRDKTPRPAGFDSLEQQAFLNLWRTYDRLKALEEQLFQRYELTAQQYNALRLLRAVSPGSLPTLELATRLVSRAPDITRLLDRLDARGLINRRREDANRRVVQVAITPAGCALLDRLRPELRACHQRQLGHLRPAELQTLVELLRAARMPHEENPPQVL